jgi:hypothetical protein
MLGTQASFDLAQLLTCILEIRQLTQFHPNDGYITFMMNKGRQTVACHPNTSGRASEAPSQDKCPDRSRAAESACLVSKKTHACLDV